MNSGTTCDMLHYLKKFVDFRKLDATEMTLSSGHSDEALGIGIIELNDNVPNRNQQRCRYYETLHVSRLSYNRMSVSKATKSGKFCIFIVVDFSMKSRE